MMTIVGLRSKSNGARRFNVGRPGPLGNPCEVGRDGSHAEVVGKYRPWLDYAYEKSSAVREKIDEIADAAKRGDVELGCPGNCKAQGLPCHGDVIKEFIEKRLAS
jgi:hypothetical protein